MVYKTIYNLIETLLRNAGKEVSLMNSQKRPTYICYIIVYILSISKLHIPYIQYKNRSSSFEK